MSRVKLLFYAINGTGLGHMTRLLAVARSVRELLAGLGLDGDLRFITSSEASDVAWDFPVYKLPSKTVAREVGLARQEFEASCKLFVSNLVASFAPHVLIVDTVPQGSYREMSFLLSYADRSVYIDRHKDPSVSKSDLQQRHVSLYDKVLVPDHSEAAERYHHPKAVLTRRSFIGPIHGFCRSKALSREQVRENFGVEPDQRLLYVSGGGGSDSREFLDETVERLAANPKNFVLVGYGPLHRGECLYRRNVVPLLQAESRRFFPALDAALSAGGYNSFQELLAASVPSVFYAQKKGMDRQDERIEMGGKAGWNLTIDSLSPEAACQALESLLDGPIRVGVLDSLAQRPEALGATRAAAEILVLHSSRENSPINRSRLYQVALWRMGWDSGQLRFDFSKMAVWARKWLKHVCHREAVERAGERAVLDWQNKRSPGQELLAWSARLLAMKGELGSELIRAWTHKRKYDLDAEPAQRRALGEVLDVLEEHFGSHWEQVLEELLSGFKRPEQRDALVNLTGRLDEEGEPGLAEDVIHRLRSQTPPWTLRELEFTTLKQGSR